MQQVLCIGDNLVPVDDDMKDIADTSKAITDAAEKYKADVLAIISKGDTHSLVTQYHVDTTQLVTDIIRVCTLINALADTYNASAQEIMEAVSYALEEINNGEDNETS